MKKISLLIYFIYLLVVSSRANGQQLRIGVFRDYTANQVVFDYHQGSYNVYGDTTYLASLLPTESIQLTVLDNDSIELKYNFQKVGNFKKITIIENQLNNSISVQLTSPKAKRRNYEDDFEIFVQNKSLTIVNLVDIDNYLAGVIESEGGGNKELEYYKVQALISRTYLFKNIHRHDSEGFNLCDRVHCQAYHNMLWYTPSIDSAVRETDDLVLEDNNNRFIDALFHSNCGGQTANAKYVWNNEIPYLQSFKDTFCIYTKQAVWEKRIPQQQWADFLVNKYNYPINDSVYGPLIFTFNQPERLAFYHSAALGIPLRDIRDQFHLRSTYFNAYPDGADVVLKGRGYGHGVGLCQEGAMKMAFYKYNFRQIALYYFSEAKIVNLKQTELFDYQYDVEDLTNGNF